MVSRIRANLASMLMVILSMLINQLAFAQEVRVVIAEGVGKDPLTAMQDAAKNALTNMVGSFLDVETLLNKRTEITNGIRSQTIQIKKDIREYSQGSIQSFEVLEINDDGGLTRVSAKVSVRVAEFKAYVKKLAEGSVGIDKGLFVEMKSAIDQQTSISKILLEPIQAVFSGQVQQFSIGKVSTVRNSNLEILKYYSAEGQNDIVIPVTTTLSSDFLQNLKNTFNNTAENAIRSSSCQNDDGWCFNKYQSSNFVIGVGSKSIEAQNDELSTTFDGYLYTFNIPYQTLRRSMPDNIGMQLASVTHRKSEDRRKSPDRYNSSIKSRFLELRLTVLSENGQELYSQVTTNGNDGKFQRNNRSNFQVITEDRSSYPWVMMYGLGYAQIPAISPEKKFWIVAKLEPSIIANASSIKLSLE